MMETCYITMSGFTSNPIEFDGIKTRILALAEEQEAGI
jgi:hypothetical protein